MSDPGPTTSFEGDDELRHLYAGVDAALSIAPVWTALARTLNCSPAEIFGFHVAAICHAQAHRTDGLVHVDVICTEIGEMITGEPILYAESLVECGVWTSVDDLHYGIVGWAQWNTTRQEWERNREVCRQAGQRSGAARREPRGSNQMVQDANHVVQTSEAEAKRVEKVQDGDSPGVNHVVPPDVRGGKGGSVQVPLLQGNTEQVQDPEVPVRKPKKHDATPADLREIWNAGCGTLPKWLGMPEGLARSARARLKELPQLDEWRKVVAIIATNRFCLGGNKRKWKAGPAFLLRELTWSRALNGEIEAWGNEQMTANERRQDIAERNKTATPTGRLHIITGDDGDDDGE